MRSAREQRIVHNRRAAEIRVSYLEPFVTEVPGIFFDRLLLFHDQQRKKSDAAGAFRYFQFLYFCCSKAMRCNHKTA